MAAGHSDARNYPLPYVFEEIQIVVERENREEASRAVLTQLAIGSVISKKAAKAFEKQVKQLTGK